MTALGYVLLLLNVRASTNYVQHETWEEENVPEGKKDAINNFKILRFVAELEDYVHTTPARKLGTTPRNTLFDRALVSYRGSEQRSREPKRRRASPDLFPPKKRATKTRKHS